ncbi:MAG: nucleotide sugar dehydrogenase [Firmicutes bacterium]|nr:nucleotide sugar dehydrogenase [Bacillota bacterium]
MKTICVIGLGYIGLPTATVLADSGHMVIGVDVNEKAVELINQGKIHITEPYLAEKVAAAVRDGRLRAQTVPAVADAFILAVPTPFTGGKKADLSYVKSAAKSLLPYLRKGSLVILESTVPPRTTCDVLVPLLAQSGFKIGRDVLVAFCPERVLPGNILKELVTNSRVVGGINEASAAAARELYATFVKGEIYETDATTAEMTKLMENTYRDVNIALANEFAKIAEYAGVNIWEAIRFANKHPRVNIHQPGPGVGGHCIAVDPWFIVEKAGGRAELIEKARQINDGMPRYVVESMKKILAGVAKPKVALLGLTYKPNVDDCRESPSLKIAEILKQEGFTVAAYDPFVKTKGAASLSEALYEADLAVLLVNHDDFNFLNPEKIGPLMRQRLVFDTRNALRHQDWEAAGFKVFVLGAGQNLEWDVKNQDGTAYFAR